ncbi:30S ribosomal protein S13 [Candidatus Woesebacteria bacterium RIFCSPLOWO2_01_FULL_39_10]|uniref:Small ribosomal subunit protein uS13 n=1 Tax=Candidatus Woesebacteria bacterium RIFCSPLOWO2_01_FULL_39_10 TaxID=1802516 RepID=A0A1F8B3M6_9BACT|nr:MAG: 30S ribosomal protein S13 [Candidatus Woesebacteria bacterium RIFCSPLOWO2_01_FULL_39_10]
MARIAGVELQGNWKVDYALTRIKGIGWSLSKKITDSLKFDQSKRISELSQDELSKLASKVEEQPIEGELLRLVRANVQRLKTIGSYRGLRHSRNLPVRGQKTRRNARTKRGKRKTVGAFKKETLAQSQSPKQE